MFSLCNEVWNNFLGSLIHPWRKIARIVCLALLLKHLTESSNLACGYLSVSVQLLYRWFHVKLHKRMGSWPCILYFLILYSGRDSGFHGAAVENQAQITSAKCDVLIRCQEEVFDQRSIRIIKTNQRLTSRYRTSTFAQCLFIMQYPVNRLSQRAGQEFVLNLVLCASNRYAVHFNYCIRKYSAIKTFYFDLHRVPHHRQGGMPPRFLSYKTSFENLMWWSWEYIWKRLVSLCTRRQADLS